MNALTRKDVEEIALLARLSLSDDEIERLRTELGAILTYMETLRELDTAGVEPMTHAVPMDLRLRADEPEASLPVETALSGAPDPDGDFFRVPSILPGGRS